MSLALIVTPAGATPTAPRSQPVAVNAASQPVRAADGRPLTYGARDLRPVGTRLAPQSAAPPVAAPPGAYGRVWSSSTYGSAIGGSGFARADLDGDGIDELLFGSSTSTFGGNDLWSVHRYVGGVRKYEIAYQSASTPEGVSALTVLPSAGTTPQRIVVGGGTGRVVAYRGTDKQVLTDVVVAAAAIRQLLLADADNDGAVDLVALTDSTTYLLDPITLATRRAVAYGASRVAIGNVDGSPQAEIVYANGWVIRQRGGSTQLLWDNTVTGFGTQVALSDIDLDGKAEIIAAQAWTRVRAYDADIHSIKWEKSTPQDIAAMRLADVTGDGQAEVLYGDGQWGSLHALQASSGKELWAVPNPEHGVTDIAVTDSDGDGALELIWGAGATSTGPDYLYVVDVASKATEWRSDDVRGPFNAVDLGDVDGDGREELVSASFESESGYADGIVSVYRTGSFKLLWSTTPSTFGGTWTGVHAVKVADLDGDGAGEILVGTDRVYDGAIYVLDGRTHAVRSEWIYDSGSPIYSLDVADVDGDGVLDIVAGGGKEHTGSPGTYVYVIDKDTGAVKWHSYHLALGWEPVAHVEVANVDADPAMEIIAVTSQIHVIDGVTHENWATAGASYRSFTVQARGGAPARLLAGTTSGQVVRVSGSSHAEQTLGSACTGPVEAVGGATGTRMLFACAGHLGSFDLAAGTTSWVTTEGDDALGAVNALITWTQDGHALVALGGRTRVTVFASP